jgi:hypothetical protein
MGIVFFCQSCGSRFEVDPHLAGKKGRCRKCGQYTKIPLAEEIVSMTAMPAVVAVGAGARTLQAPPSVRDDEGRPSLGAWLKAGITQVGLAPLSGPHRPVRPFLPSALDDAEDSRPYNLARPIVDNRGPVRIQDNALLRLWRRILGDVQKVFRWLSESAYFVSIPFLIVLLFGTAVKSRPLALFGATFVVLLNVGRLAAGTVALVLVPLRDGLNARKLKKPVRRVAEPVLTIALVVLAFTFVPWLAAGRSEGGSLAQRLRAGAEGLETDIEGEVDLVVKKANKIDVEKLGAQAQQKLKGLSGQQGEGVPGNP